MRRLWAWCLRHWFFTSALLLLLAGWVAFWNWLGPLPEPAAQQSVQTQLKSEADGGVPIPAAEDRPGVGAVAALSADAARAERALRWKEAFAAISGLSLRQAAHRAAVSGHVLDIVAVRAKAQHCAGLASWKVVNPDPQASPTPDFVLKRAGEIKQLCEGYVEVMRRQFRLLDDDGDARTADWLLRRDRTDASMEPLLEVLRQQGSPELLRALAGQISSLGLAQKLGWREGRSKLDDFVDDGLFYLAIELAACESQLNCKQVAAERFDCMALRDCVEDLRELVPRHVLGPESQRSMWIAPLPRERMGEFMIAAEQALRDLGRNPAELEQLRAELIGLCSSADCLRQRWDLAQRRVECLIGRRPMVECPPSSAPARTP